MLIIIRHSDDEVTDPTHHHDAKLTSKGKRLARKVGKKIIHKYGAPNRIYTSPFRRALETVEYMTDSDDNNIVYDPRLGRYFSSREKKNPQVHHNTLNKGITIMESYKEFHKRVDDFMDHIHKYINSKRVFWIITHALVYKRISSQYRVRIPRYIPFMDHFRLKHHCINCGK